MKRRDLKNVAASVRQRLLNAARESGQPFDEFLNAGREFRGRWEAPGPWLEE